MRPIWTSLALVLASLLYVQGYTCPPGKSKKTITLGVGESVDFSTQDADSYGKNVKCVVKFKKAKKAKCELNFSCSAFTLTAKNSNCNRGSDFLKIGKEKFCEDNSPDVTVAGRTLNVLFRSNKRSKGGEGAECEATCVDPDDETPTTVAPPATTPPTPVTTAAPTTGSCAPLIVDRSSWSGHWQAKLKFKLPNHLDAFKLDLVTDLPLDSLTFWEGTLSGSDTTFSFESPSYFSGQAGQFAEFGFQVSFSGDQEPSFTSIKLNGANLCSGSGNSPQSTAAPTTPGPSTPSVPTTPQPTTSIPSTPGQCLVSGDCRVEGTTDGQWNDDWGCENANACTSETACLDRAQSIADYCQNESWEEVCTTFTTTGSSRCAGDDGGATTANPTPATTAPATTQNPSGSTTSATPTQCSNEAHDYSEVLRLSLLFYEAQRSGPLPANNRIPWRGDSSLGDQGNKGEDLTGGYHDAGDYVKFGYPMAGAMTVLAYGGISYGAAYEAAGEMEHLKEAVKWGTDYFIKAHVSPNEFYCQVGNGVIDHEYPGRPETMTISRPAYSLTPSKPGSDCAGETAAALASASILFAGSDPTYSATLVEHAEQLFDFADSNRGLYSSSISDAGQFYRSDSYEDELIWAAAWLYKATQDQKYLDKAEDLYSKRSQTWTSWSFDWADKLPGAQLLLFELTGKNGYKTDVEAFCDAAMAVPKSPGGQTFRAKWGSNRYAANFAFICLGAAKAGIKSAEYEAYAASQINYMLGDNPNNFSYVIGYGDSFPKQPHHKAAACASPPAECTWGTFSNTGTDNPHQLNGALVGGPAAPDDYYKDDRTDYIMAEVTLDYNAGFQSTVAGLKSLSC